jgi:hypothetical protein
MTWHIATSQKNLLGIRAPTWKISTPPTKKKQKNELIFFPPLLKFLNTLLSLSLSLSLSNSYPPTHRASSLPPPAKNQHRPSLSLSLSNTKVPTVRQAPPATPPVRHHLTLSQFPLSLYFSLG